MLNRTTILRIYSWLLDVKDDSLFDGHQRKSYLQSFPTMAAIG